MYLRDTRQPPSGKQDGTDPGASGAEQNELLLVSPETRSCRGAAAMDVRGTGAGACTQAGLSVSCNIWLFPMLKLA